MSSAITIFDIFIFIPFIDPVLDPFSTPGVSELAGERWPAVAVQAPTGYAV
jgi:hypothetical protein